MSEGYSEDDIQRMEADARAKIAGLLSADEVRRRERIERLAAKVRRQQASGGGDGIDATIEAGGPPLRALVVGLGWGFVIGWILTPLTSLLTAKVYQMMWAWYLAPEFGDGPSFRAFFGVALFIRLVIVKDARRASHKDIEAHPITTVVGEAVGFAVDAVVLFLVGALAHAVLVR